MALTRLVSRVKKAVFAAAMFASAPALADPLFHRFLQSQGRTSFYEDEHRDFVAGHLEDYAHLVFADVHEMGRSILARFPPEDYLYLDVGAGPTPVAAYLEHSGGVERRNVPLSGFADRVQEDWVYLINGKVSRIPLAEYLEILRDHFERFLPADVLGRRPKVLILDTTETGTTIVNAVKRLSAYVHSIRPAATVEGLALLHPRSRVDFASHPPIHRMRLPNLLGRLVHDRVFQGLAEHTRFEPGVDISAEVKTNSLHARFAEAMKRQMASRTRDLDGDDAPCAKSLIELAALTRAD